MLDQAYPSPTEIAAEARAALARRPAKAPGEIFADLVRKGWIDARGNVTKLLGGRAEPENDYENWSNN